jgi:hypothetical protein
VDWWRDESPRGRLRRAAICAISGAVIIGAQAVQQFLAGPRPVGIALTASAGSLAAGAGCLLFLIRKLDDSKPRRRRTVDPGRYLTVRGGRPVTIDTLRRSRTWHNSIGTGLIVVIILTAAIATLASGGSGKEYVVVMFVVSVVLVLPAFTLVVIDRLKINSAIDTLLASAATEPSEPETVGGPLGQATDK